MRASSFMFFVVFLVFQAFSGRPDLIVAIFWPFLYFSGPLWAGQKQEKKGCRICQSKTALIERFRRVKPHFRHKSLFRFVRRPRRWSFFIVAVQF